MAKNPGSRMVSRFRARRTPREEPGPGQNLTVEIDSGPSNFSPAHVPWGVDLAAAWSWRFLVIAGATLVVLYLVKFFVVIVLPLVVAVFFAALVSPVVGLLERARIRRSIGALLVVVLGLAIVGVALTFIGQQIVTGITDLSDQVVSGLGEIRHWLRHGPLHASNSQINEFIHNAQTLLTERAKALPDQLTEITSAVGHIVAGIFIVLFGTYFFLADGQLIWAWLVRLFPRAARRRADSSGRVAWRSLVQFVRATVLVAATDALGIAIVAAVLGLPLVSTIGLLVFIGAFVPMIGATISGTVAVLVALVAKGPVVALIMLGGVVLVQQIEAHVLQPFLMGRFVSVHPLGVIVAVAAGVLVAGIPGALVAVPLTASVNAVVQHLASYTRVGEQPDDASERDPATPADRQPGPSVSP
ncbi:MAG TPA: AI-2E family transporter [Marmoricola sp.]|nr:AI-2E family transporter [Marmoricola sp.]